MSRWQMFKHDMYIIFHPSAMDKHIEDKCERCLWHLSHYEGTYYE